MIVDYVLLASFTAITTFLGWNIVSLIQAPNGNLSLCRFETIGLSYIFGIGVISAQMFIMSLFGAGFTRLNILSPWIAIVTINLIMVLRSRSLRSFEGGACLQKQTPLCRFRLPARGEIALICLITLQVLYNFFRALVRPIESYDAVAIYGLKSKMIYLAGGLGADFFQSLVSNFRGAHPDYPLLIPLAQSWFYTFLGRFDDILVKAIFPLFYLSCVFLIYGAIRRVSANRILALISVYALASIKQFSDYSTIGYADLALGIYFAVSLIYLYMWFLSSDNTQFLRISLVGSVACLWVKNEGALLVLIILLTLISFTVVNIYHVLFLRKRKKRVSLKPVVIYMLVCILCMLGWAGFKSGLGLINENFNLSMINSTDFIRGLPKIPLILYEYQKQIFGFKKWNIIWVLFFLLALVRPRTIFRGNIKYLTFAFILFALGYTSMYMFSAVDIGFFLQTSASRFPLHILPSVIFWMAVVWYERDPIQEQ
ncbi:MAG: hypothetical protein ABID09_00015 [Candidatus Omnitrophota bacterium]